MRRCRHRSIALAATLALATGVAAPGCATYATVSRVSRNDPATTAVILAIVLVGVVVGVATDHGDVRPPKITDPPMPDPVDISRAGAR